MDEDVRLKRCTVCGMRPVSEFGLDSSAKDKLKARCRRCIGEAERRLRSIRTGRVIEDRVSKAGLVGNTEEERTQIEANYRVVKAEKDARNETIRAKRDRSGIGADLDRFDGKLGNERIWVRRGRLPASVLRAIERSYHRFSDVFELDTRPGGECE